MSIIKRTVCLLVVSLIVQTSASAETIDSDALRAANRDAAAGDFDKAFTEYRRLAKETNNPLAMFSLGLMYKNGTGCSVSEGKACEWFEKAAQEGIPFAMHLYAQCLQKGVNHPANPTLAAKWYEKAAEMGCHLSLSYLADLYMKGDGVPKDAAKALELCHNAVKSGSTPALVWMGKFCLQRDDPMTAMKWFEEAARHDLPEAQYYIGWMLILNASEQNLSTMAREWFEKAASQGYIPAYAPTGKLYFNGPVDPSTGWLSEKELAKAYMWLSAASKKSKERETLVAVGNMLEKIRDIMPKTWVPDLDRRVEEHLSKYP